MCPVCLATAAVWVVGTASTGGVAALVLRKTLAQKSPPHVNPSTSNKENHDEKHATPYRVAS